MAERTGASRGVAGLAAGAIALPLAALVVRAAADRWPASSLFPDALGLRGFTAAFGTGDATLALVNSVVIAVATTAAALAIGWPAARVLGERRLRRPALTIVLLGAPLLVSPYLVGTGLAEWFIRLELADSYAGLGLAHLVMVLPYVVLILVPAFGPRLQQLEEMSAALGVDRRRRVLWVTVPSIRPALAAAALLGFLVSLSQYGTSLAVGGGRPLLPLVMLPFVRSDPQVAATLALLFLVPAVAAVALAMRAGRAPL